MRLERMSLEEPLLSTLWKEGCLPDFTGREEYHSLKPYIAITDKTRKNLMMTLFSK